MSSETDHPRQRTVAELLAEHGDAGVTGRRRRRREADEPEAAEQAPVGAAPDSAGPRGGGPNGVGPNGSRPGPTGWRRDEPDRSVLRQPAPSESRPQPMSSPAPPMPFPGARTPPPFAPGPMPVPPPPAAAPPSISSRATPPAVPVRDAGARRSGSGRMPEWEPRDRTSTTSAEARENGRAENGHAENGHPENGGPGRNGAGTRSVPGPDRSAEQLPRFGSARGATARPVDPARSPDLGRLPEPPRGAGALDPGLTGPIQRHRPSLGVSGVGSRPDDLDAGPATTIGAAPVGAESWHRARTAAREAPARDAAGDVVAHDTFGRDVAGRDTTLRGRTGRDLGRDATVWDTIGRGGARRDVVDDGGPETQAGPLDLDDFDDDSYDGERGLDLPDNRTVGGRKRARDDDFDHPAGLDPVEEDAGPQRRLGRAAAEAAASPGQAWMAMVVQWIIGALGGAALWVGFRFLWRSLPVVALGAAVLVTIGLVVIVRALLHNDDRRTTVFAVLVGLLLTISPAILVLLDR